MAFLEVLTRTTGRRPRLLRRCQDSLKQLGDPDWTQTLVEDREGRGVAWANLNLATVDAAGDWVWALDDDDLCCYADLVTDLKQLARGAEVDVVAVRVYHSKFGLLPPYEMWGQRPMMGRIGGACVIVRRDVWQAHRDGWTEVYAGDFWYINKLWDAGLRWAWLPVIAAWQPQQSNGAMDNA